MKKQLAETDRGALRKDYDLSKLKDGVRGKYYQRVEAAMSLSAEAKSKTATKNTR